MYNTHDSKVLRCTHPSCHSPVRQRPFFRGELMLPPGTTGKGQRKSLWSLFSAETKSSTRATRFRSRHSQPMSSKPSCAEKQPRSRRRTCSRRWRAWRHSIMSMYMFSAHSASRLTGINTGGWRDGERKRGNILDVKVGTFSWKHNPSCRVRRCGGGSYPLTQGPEGILKVFCKLNLPVAMPSADCDKLMLRFLKNSNPPVELGS